jgi:membrane-bound lytic murein transglycosylase B
MMKKLLLWVALAVLPGVAAADAALLARADVQRYIDEQVATGKLNRPELEAVFANVVPKPNILAILDRPSTARPWYLFRPSFMSDRLLNNGVRFWAQHQEALVRAEKQYGVPPELIVAILGIETNFGRNTGSFRVADVLTTIGFNYPRRAEYFRGELTQLLWLAHEENIDPLSLKGSYAGAMGWPQFMPSSFRKWAVDFDGDGHRDIWNNADDAIGSVAHYFQQYGWVPGDDVMVPASVAAGVSVDSLVSDKFNLHYTVAELRAKGVVPQLPLPDNAQAVLVPLEVAPGETEYWLGLKNFYVITRYNKSTLYARVAQEMAVVLKSRFAATRLAQSGN